MTKTMTKNNILKRLTKAVILIPRPLMKSSTHPLIYMVYGESDLSCSSNVRTCGKLWKSSDDNFDSKIFNAAGLGAGESYRAPEARRLGVFLRPSRLETINCF